MEIANQVFDHGHEEHHDGEGSYDHGHADHHDGYGHGHEEHHMDGYDNGYGHGHEDHHDGYNYNSGDSAKESTVFFANLFFTRTRNSASIIAASFALIAPAFLNL